MRARLMDAGLSLFLSFGFRGVSMEAVAMEAEVAKPTLYKYFPDKEALFQAGVVQFIEGITQVCQAEFDGDGSASERISGALVAKHKMFFRLVEGSVFAEELYSETARIAAKDFGMFERWLELEIDQILLDENIAKAVMVRQLIFACAFGIGKKAQRVEEIGPAIRLITQKLLD